MEDLSTLALPFLALLVAGAAAGFAGGLFGIGGGFVVVPALVLALPLMGTQPQDVAHVAVGTSLATIIFTSLRALQSHARRDAVDFETLKAWAPWIVIGVGLGTLIAEVASGKAMLLIFGAGVLIMSVHFLMPVLRDRQVWHSMPSGIARAGIAGSLGTFSSLLGIGGGTLVTIVMTLSGTGIHRAIGTASGMGVVIALPGTIGFAAISWSAEGLPWGSLGYVNLPAAAAIVVTSIATAPLGVAAAHKLSPPLLRRVFGFYLVFIGVLMIRNGLAE